MVDKPLPNENGGAAAPATDAPLAATAVADTKAAQMAGTVPAGAAPAGKAAPASAASPAPATKAASAKNGSAPDREQKEREQKESEQKEGDKKAAPDDPGLDDRVGRLDWMTVVPSWLVSLIFHMSLLFLLAMVVEPAKIVKHVADLVATDAEVGQNLDQIVTADLPPGATELGQTEGLADAISMSPDADGTDISTLNELPAAPGGPGDVSDLGLAGAQVIDLGKALRRRRRRRRRGHARWPRIGRARRRRGKALAMERGGSEASENAVGMALNWIAIHQNPDGSWNFNHRKGPCQGRCGNAGKLEHGDIAATAIALLPFLGAGQTHLQGNYKKNVQAGLYYLVSRMKVGPDGGDLSYDQGVMYGHGLASIALCEAYGMTKDTGLAEPAQQAVNFIVYAQDPVGGGWRYTPKQAGDTSVLGWQLMALKSAHMAYLNVPPKTIKGAVNFLNSVQGDSGATYGYVNPGKGPATTAIGLLCRMYLGWKHDEPALERGVDALSAHGPSPNNMYFNYYATQVMHHYEGEQWTKWNNKMRDFLVNAQSRQGHERGSWFLGGDHSSEQGGRLYTTAMCAMTLEVYYRHLPIYRKDSTTADFDE